MYAKHMSTVMVVITCVSVVAPVCELICFNGLFPDIGGSNGQLSCVGTHVKGIHVLLPTPVGNQISFQPGNQL